MSTRPLVLVAVDASRDTDTTVRYAAAVARGMAADLHAIQVVSRAGALWQAPRAEVELRARLRALRPEVEHDGVAFRIVTLRGRPDRAVAAYAQLEPARLIVAGPRYGSRRLWRHTAITRRLARTSRLPVLVVPASAEVTASVAWRRIVAAVGPGSEGTVAMRTAADVARRHGAALTMFHAIPSSKELVFTGSEAMRMLRWLAAETRTVTEILTTWAAALGQANATAVVLTGDPFRGLLRTAEETAADLIVMSVSPRPWLSERLSGSTLRDVLLRTRVPVLVAPAAQARIAGDGLDGPDEGRGEDAPVPTPGRLAA